MVRLIILAASILSVICVILRHRYKIEWLNNYFPSDSETHIFYYYHEIIAGADKDIKANKKRYLTKWFIAEILVLLICPIPYFDAYISIDCKSGHAVVYLLSEF